MERFGNFLVFMSEVMHFKRNTKGFIKSFHHRAQLIHHDIGFSSVADGSGAAVDIVEVFGGIYDRACLYILAVVVDEDIFHDRQQPGLEVRAGDKFIHIADGPECSFLVQVFCFFTVFRQLIREGVQGATEA